MRLVNCGPWAQAALEDMCARLPMLSANGCVIIEERFQVEDGLDKKSPHYERTRAKRTRFPSEDLAGLDLDGVVSVLERGYYTP